jgi:DNA replication protein DnaC
MRTEEDWIKRIYPQRIKKFSLRIQHDLKIIDVPKNIPEIIESTFIFGKVNTGKTLRAIFMMLQEEKQRWMHTELIDNIYQEVKDDYVFISAPELLNEIKCGFDCKENSDQDIINKYSSVYFLIIDELGIEKVSDWVLQTLYLIINRRYESMMKTIITSNFSLDELAVRLNDDRITSRIERMCKIEEKLDYKIQA